MPTQTSIPLSTRARSVTVHGPDRRQAVVESCEGGNGLWTAGEGRRQIPRVVSRGRSPEAFPGPFPDPSAFMKPTSAVPELDRPTLLAAARAAAAHAHAPYSRFRVGAVVLAADGRVFPGCNVENASYGLALCAERSALASAVAAGAREFVAVAVACVDADAGLGVAGRTPCGACRQWLLELAPEAVIHLDGVERTYTVRELLPDGFRL